MERCKWRETRSYRQMSNRQKAKARKTARKQIAKINKATSNGKEK